MKTYTVNEIAEMLETNPETVRRWIRSKKLVATKASRKEGNIITEDMLQSFLKQYPKYAAVAEILLAPLGGATVVAATALGSVIAQQSLRNDPTKNATVSPIEIIKLLNANISKTEENINRKLATIRQLETEIEQDRLHIAESQALIDQLKNSLTPTSTTDKEEQ